MSGEGVTKHTSFYNKEKFTYITTNMHASYHAYIQSILNIYQNFCQKFDIHAYILLQPNIIRTKIKQFLKNYKPWPRHAPNYSL